MNLNKKIVWIVLSLFLMSCRHTTNNSHSLEPTQERKIVWNLFNIAIGKSTKEELTRELGTPYRQTQIESELYQDQVLIRYNYSMDDAGELDPEGSNHISFYLIDNVVFALRLGVPSVPNLTEYSTINDIVDQFGYPDLVAFDRCNILNRIAVWLDEGFQISFVIIPFGENTDKYTVERTAITEIIYFFPMQEVDYFQSYWSSCYSTERPESDVIDIYLMNPFLENE